MPSKGPLDLTLSPNEMQAALQHRLGLPLSHPGEICAACNARPLDKLGHHHLTCTSGSHLVSRHNRVRDTFFSLCKMAGMSPSLEQGAFHRDRSRPADILAPHFSLGKPGAFDVTVVSPLSSVNLSGAGSSDVVSTAAAVKHVENDPKCGELGWTCIPLAVDSYGQWCEEAHEAFAQIAQCLSTRTKVGFSTCLSSIYNSLGVVLARQNARSILAKRALPLDVGGREVYQLSGFSDRS